jgi:hypothetical protein
MCSHRVFSIAPCFNPICCPNSSPSHLYSWAKGGDTTSFHKFFYFWGVSIVSTFFFLVMGQSNWLIVKKKKRHPQLINIKWNKYL